MKKFFVSKDDASRVAFIKDAIEKTKPSNVYIICEKDRADLYKSIDAVNLPLKKLNKTENWIEFVNSLNEETMLVVDNFLKFIYFGDGKKEYIKNISQKINNIIITDVVPFYTEPAELYYPFWFLGKSILGYNSYNTFKSNHFEEKDDGSFDLAHSFSVLRDKIKDYYIQDYSAFWKEREIVEWQLTENEFNRYQRKKQEVEAYKNPIHMMTVCADYTNLTKSKTEYVERLINGKTAVVINYSNYKRQLCETNEVFYNVDFLSYHQADYSAFSNYDTIIFYENIIVRPHAIFYIEPHLKGRLYCLLEGKTNIDRFLFNRIYSIELRNQFDSFFYGATI